MSPTKQSENETGRIRTVNVKRPPRKHLIPPKILVPILIVFCLAAVLVIKNIADGEWRKIDNPKVAQLAKIKVPKWIDQQIIPRSCDSRRGDYLEDFTGIVVHYVGNPGTTAKQNRDYFANPGTEVNAHFLVGLNGEVIQCLPLAEKSSASSERNRDTISIEVCHPDEGGEFSDRSYQGLIRLTTWLCMETDLDPTQVIRHYDVTGKECPVFYVKHPEAWEAFQADLKDTIDTIDTMMKEDALVQ
jgi:hypothetical protein